MGSTRRLRLRFLAVLSGGVLLGSLPLACSGETEARQLQTTTCSSGARTMKQCFEPGSTHFNVGNTPMPPPTPTPRFDANNCQVRDQVSDGCCNPAEAGPELIDGQCCYGFCTGSCCGRPLFVDGEARVAPVAARGDWSELVEVEASGLAPGERQELARQWLADAQLEHASIASFARFTLDLLAFGAPAELLALAQRAMADEIAHARLCFGLASVYAGEPLGPGPLNLAGVSPSSSLATAAAAAVREGCINETIAALAAEQQLGRAVDPGVQAVLARIARDEAEHAELAWRFVCWALQTGDASVANAVRAALQAQPPPAAGDERNELAAHGRLSASELAQISRAAWREVITPCAHALS